MLSWKYYKAYRSLAHWPQGNTSFKMHGNLAECYKYYSDAQRKDAHFQQFCNVSGKSRKRCYWKFSVSTGQCKGTTLHQTMKFQDWCYTTTMVWCIDQLQLVSTKCMLWSLGTADQFIWSCSAGKMCFA